MDPATEWVTAPPSPLLAPFIDRYVGYRSTGLAAGVHRGLPSGHMTFIVSIGPGIEVATHADPAQAPAAYRCVVSGLQAGPALIAQGSHQEGVAVELTPLGCRALFGMPAAALWCTTVELADVAGAAGRELWERLQAVAPWSERFAVCDEVLGRLARRDGVVGPELAAAWRALVRSGGTLPVGDLARDIGWSRQHLARRFGQEFGAGPKLAARLLRFERAAEMLRGMPPFVTIAQVAAACGYYDQAHLDRDFAELAGCPPTAWLAAELPSFQDRDGAPARSSTA